MKTVLIAALATITIAGGLNARQSGPLPSRGRQLWQPETGWRRRRLRS